MFHKNIQKTRVMLGRHTSKRRDNESGMCACESPEYFPVQTLQYCYAFVYASLNIISAAVRALQLSFNLLQSSLLMCTVMMSNNSYSYSTVVNESQIQPLNTITNYMWIHVCMQDL